MYFRIKACNKKNQLIINKVLARNQRHYPRLCMQRIKLKRIAKKMQSVNKYCQFI